MKTIENTDNSNNRIVLVLAAGTAFAGGKYRHGGLLTERIIRENGFTRTPMCTGIRLPLACLGYYPATPTGSMHPLFRGDTAPLMRRPMAMLRCTGRAGVLVSFGWVRDLPLSCFFKCHPPLSANRGRATTTSIAAAMSRKARDRGRVKKTEGSPLESAKPAAGSPPSSAQDETKNQRSRFAFKFRKGVAEQAQSAVRWMSKVLLFTL